MSVLLAVLLGAAAGVGLGWRPWRGGIRRRGATGRWWARWRGAGGLEGFGRRGGRGGRGRGGGRRGGDLPVGLVCVQVASRLRSGAAPEVAWREELARWGVVPVGGERDVGPVLEGLQGRSRTLDSAIAACRLAAHSGAPLADVLDGCSQTIAEADEAERDRARALAGPATTARILAWLPVAGLALGVLVGADPVTVLAGGGLGTLCLVVGVVLALAGRAWIAGLVAAAAREPGSARQLGSARR